MASEMSMHLFCCITTQKLIIFPNIFWTFQLTLCQFCTCKKNSVCSVLILMSVVNYQLLAVHILWLLLTF